MAGAAMFQRTDTVAATARDQRRAREVMGTSFERRGRKGPTDGDRREPPQPQCTSPTHRGRYSRTPATLAAVRHSARGIPRTSMPIRFLAAAAMFLFAGFAGVGGAEAEDAP